ncbi:MAG: L-threonylcarbamoyladenylate synthase [Pseudomonadota bacterium]|nr:L-threonylcarbamoyladenylate synthase [Pseudomonadota bacterium]
MSLRLRIHPDNPQPRLINQVVDIIRKGGVVIYPTDTAYAIGCKLDEKNALDVIKQIRRLDDKHLFTLLCRDLSEIANYAKVENWQYRLIKSNTPGAYTFILDATTEVPRRLMHPKRRTIGLRVPDHAISQSLLEAVGEPLITATLQMPGDEFPLMDPDDIEQVLGHQVDVIIDGGYGMATETTVVSLLGDNPELIREGDGDISTLGL